MCVCRVFVNRSVSMDKIKYIGFDMDHTLAGISLIANYMYTFLNQSILLPKIRRTA